MRLSEINPTDILKTILVEQGVKETIYNGDKPTDKIPAAYIELYQNGGTSTDYSKMGFVKGYVLISITVKLLSSGGRNTKKERLMLEQFDTLFSEVISKDGYVFMLEPNNMVYGGGSIYEGYTTKLINLTYNYYGNQ